MPGEQDIVSLGIDISSFDSQKIAVLKTYISIFNDLSKFDGKIFNPVMGDGLATFNTSIAQTNKLIDEMNAKLLSLNNSKSNYAAQAGIIKVIDNNLVSARGSGQAFGITLTHMLGYLRNIAYILPGIGLAGIFNLAFQAISSAAEAIGLFESGESKALKKNAELNNSLKDSIDRYEELRRVVKAFSEDIDNASFNSLTESSPYYNQDANSFFKEKNKSDLLSSRGYDQGKILQQKIDFDKIKLSNIESSINATSKYDGSSGLNALNLQKEINDYTVKISTLDKDITNISEAIVNKHKSYSLFRDKEINKDDLKEAKDDAVSSRQLIVAKYNQMISLLKEYYTIKNELDKDNKAIEKYNSDQSRKLLVETTKDNISVQQNKNKQILSDIRSTHEERLKAIKAERDEQEKINNIERVNVTGTKENPNLQFSENTAEYKIAINKQNTENLKAKQKFNEDTLKENIEFYQSQLKAQIEIQKNEVGLSAINNEKIQQNEHSSLEERLFSYSKYIDEKTKLEQLEFELSSSAGKQSKDDKESSLTKLQIDKLASDRDKQILVHKADAESKIYEIVYSSLQKQLNAIIVAGETEGAYNNHKLIQDLEANNSAYKNKEISLRKYLKIRADILEKDQRDALDKDINDDRKQQKRLFDLQQDALVGLDTAEKKLEDAKSLPDNTPDKKFIVDKSEGEVNAKKQNLEDVNKEVEINNKKLENDRLKKAKIEYGNDNKLRNEWINAALEIEKALYKGIKEIGDRIYENRISNIERQRQAMDEQYDMERDAITKSSLNAKDKAALDIQIAEQKHEFDVASKKEERQLKIEEAIFNKKLAIADAVINISAAIIRDGLTTPKSIADAVIGGIQLATIITTDIPSYKEGIKSTPKGEVARYGEDGPEAVKIPGKDTFIALKETISYLPKGTEIIPLRDDYPVFTNSIKDESWEQTKFLAKYITRSNKKEINNIFKPNIIVDMNFESRKRQILGN